MRCQHIDGRCRLSLSQHEAFDLQSRHGASVGRMHCVRWLQLSTNMSLACPTVLSSSWLMSYASTDNSVFRWLQIERKQLERHFGASNREGALEVTYPNDPIDTIVCTLWMSGMFFSTALCSHPLAWCHVRRMTSQSAWTPCSCARCAAAVDWRMPAAEAS